MRSCVLIVVAACLCQLQGAEVVAQVQSSDPADRGWLLAGEARVDTVDGEPVVYLRSGRALRKDVRFSDGTIEFEMRPTDRRAFLGVVFRAAIQCSPDTAGSRSGPASPIARLFEDH